MQRNNNFLRHQHNGVALITAIFLLVFIASIVSLVMSMNAQTSKSTGDIFLRDQAQLLSKSATEFAVLAISGHDRTASGACLNSVTSQYPATNPVFDINTTIRYIGNGFPAGCNMLAGANNIVRADANGTVIIDVYVSVNNTTTLTEPIRVHRRTIQKP